jgi:flagellar biosynthesis/type III secretory pathway chaperone
MAESLSLQKLQKNLEAFLVQEFRTCQSLAGYTKNERQALLSNDVDALLSIVEQKETSLDELYNLENQRRELMGEIASEAGLQLPDPAYTDIFPYLEVELAERIRRIQEGMLVLLNNIGKLNFGNNALALSALERVDAVQAFILKLYQPNDSYRAPGMPNSQEGYLKWSVDQKA